MDLMAALETYFRGEKATGIALVPLGLTLVGFALFTWRSDSGGFRWAMALSLGLVGAAAAVGGAALALKTGPQVQALEALHAQNPSALVASEVPRMQQVNANWPRLKLAWGILALGAVVLVLFVSRDWARGLGASLLLAAALAMMVDTFAERRAVRYTQALAAFEGASPD